MDMSGIEPDTFRMRSERDNQLHHMPIEGSLDAFSPLVIPSGLGQSSCVHRHLFLPNLFIILQLRYFNPTIDTYEDGQNVITLSWIG